MKRNKLCLLLVALSALMLLVGTLSIPVMAAEPAPTVSIDRFNLSFEDSVYIKYAVRLTGADASELGTENFRVLFWTSPQEEYTVDTAQASAANLGYQTIGGTKYYIFSYDDLAAKQMTDDIYARAYIKVDGKVYYSNVEKYSVLQYAYNKLGYTGTATTDAELKDLLNGMLSYGAAAQKYFDYNTDRLASARYYQITVVGATLPDGFSQGLYQEGERVEVTAPAQNADGVPFAYWTNTAGEEVSRELCYTIPVTTTNETYTAVYCEEDLPAIPHLLFTMLSNGTYSVKANPDVEMPTEVIIPETYQDVVVTEIEASAFKGITALKSITIPGGIVTVGEEAFAGCTGLEELNLPATVKTIGNRAFQNCSGITEFTVPSSVTNIGTQIFNGCTALNTVYYNSTYADQNNPFLAIESIETIVFGGTYVPSFICTNNTFVKTVTMTKDVTEIDWHAFSGCENLTSVTIGDNVTRICGSAFAYCSNLTSIIIPDSVTSIGSSAFSGCSSLVSIIIPEGVTSIGSYAFYHCSSLTSITIPEGVTSIDSSAFSDCSSLTSIIIPEGVTEIKDQTFYNCESLTTIIIPEGVTRIGSHAFSGCSSLTSIIIPEGVASIGSYAFAYCSNLTSIIIPDSVTSIGSHAFAGCSNLTSIIIPEGVMSIGGSAFAGCSNLKAITIPSSVISIASYAFYNCSNIESVYITDLAAWCKISFQGDYSNPLGQVCDLYINNQLATEITIPAGVTSIGDRTFFGYSNLTSIIIPEGVTSIGSSAFAYCKNLTSIVIPEGVISIGDKAFENCNNLASITIPDSVTAIGSFAFYGCSSLTSISIPKGVTGIGEYTFDGCNSLTSIVISKALTDIDYRAFDGCRSLTTVYYGGTESDWSGISINTNNTDLISNNTDLISATRYYYSESEPTEEGNYWRYVNGVPTPW